MIIFVSIWLKNNGNILMKSVKICKVCGRLPRFDYIRPGSDYTKLYNYIRCDECGACTNMYEDKYDAEDEWNKMNEDAYSGLASRMSEYIDNLRSEAVRLPSKARQDAIDALDRTGVTLLKEHENTWM